MPLSAFWKRSRKVEGIEATPVEQLAPKSADVTADQMARGLQNFGLALLKHQCSQKPKQNVFISPLSVYLALAMVENGAGGQTRTAMRKVLELAPAAPAQSINAAAKKLQDSLGKEDGVELSIANALWADADAPLAPAYVTLCAEAFHAAARELHLKDPVSAEIINQWVAEKTQNKIPQIVTPQGIADSIVVITNAVYFKGKFLVPFPKDATQPKPFHLADGRKKQVPMMQKLGLAGSYRSGKGFEAARLTYEGPKGATPPWSKIELFLILPVKGVAPEELMNERTVMAVAGSGGEFLLDLYTPRFSIDYESGLIPSLTLMGMGIAFGRQADFVAMGSKVFHVGEVIHKTRLEVDEEGTTAAGATAIFMAPTAMPRRNEPERKTLVFDRPFAVLLRDKDTAAILFAGVIYEP